jgi:hypothetical protein
MGREIRCRLDHRQSLFGDGFRHREIHQGRATTLAAKGNHADKDCEGCLAESYRMERLEPVDPRETAPAEESNGPACEQCCRREPAPHLDDRQGGALLCAPACRYSRLSLGLARKASSHLVPPHRPQVGTTQGDVTNAAEQIDLARPLRCGSDICHDAIRCCAGSVGTKLRRTLERAGLHGSRNMRRRLSLRRANFERTGLLRGQFGCRRLWSCQSARPSSRPGSPR